MSKKDYRPILKTKKDINREAIEAVEVERTGKQLGLKTRFSQINAALGKYFRFGKVVLIAGLSGHGKSTLLNMFLQDFLDKRINGKFEEDVIIIHNTFEMLPVDEVLRVVSGKVEKSHLELLSSQWEKPTGKYNTITDEELEKVRKALDEDEDSNHYYFEEPTSMYGIMMNIKAGVDHYKEKYNTDKVPKVVVAIDHTLLVEADKGENALEFMARMGKFAVHLKKQGYLVMLIGQFNNEIEKSERIKNADLHFPIKSDIYAQSQVFNACDIVITIHQPELLGILYYGKNLLSTALLVHIQFIKQRFGKVGSVWLQNQLNRGRFIPFEPESNRKPK